MKINRNEIWAEMARRKVQFHPTKDWDTIRLWGLFRWRDIAPLLESGELITDMKPENKTVWAWPSKDTWENHIKPLIDKHTLKELSRMAGL